jgi:hypothetical protein
MLLDPSDECVPALKKVFDTYNEIDFPSLREQFDEHFDQRYKGFWEYAKGNKQQKLWNVLDSSVNPCDARVELDTEICRALGYRVKRKEFIDLYDVLVKEMILIKGLKRD